MKINPAGLKKFNKEQARLGPLVDKDPIKAIKEARALSSETPVDGILLTGLKASILIDAGSCANDKHAIEDGITLFRELVAGNPEEASFHYNLGNGLVALADQESYGGYDWYLTTAATRREARSQFQKAISSDNNLEILSRSLTNLGNALWRTHRWVEAYDAYARALVYDSSNAVASTGAARLLLRCVSRGIGDKQMLQSVAARHVRNAKLHPERIGELAGARAQEQLSKLLQKKLGGGRLPNLNRAEKYDRFVGVHRLALSPTIEGLDCSLKRWDSLGFDSILEPAGGDSGVPPLFAMLNVMKADYLAARYLAYQALSGVFPESGLYSDTLDYAIYGVVPSMLALAQRACIDVLDKIAVATTEYFGIPGAARDVYFSNRWFASSKKGQPLAWHPSLLPHIDKGNTAVISLGEISLDMGEGGALHRKRAYRHSSTHRFTVLHDIGCSASRESAHVEHCKVTDFKSHLVESLQLARAALLYFVEMVSISEAGKKPSNSARLLLNVPTHHYIRGEDDRKPRNRGLVPKGVRGKK